jgi:hypothetical protein
MTVLGLGMAVTVAPLTTTVMNSVGESRAGIASGINNAVSRVAGALAIAVLGLVMLGTFARHLPPELVPQKAKLAAIETSDPGMRRAIDESFVSGFRMVMLCSSALALLSAGTAFLWIGKEPR